MVRRKCTKENPYTLKRDKEELGWGWEHSNVVEIGEQENGFIGGDIVTERCMNCKRIWRHELVQWNLTIQLAASVGLRIVSK